MYSKSFHGFVDLRYFKFLFKRGLFLFSINISLSVGISNIYFQNSLSRESLSPQFLDATSPIKLVLFTFTWGMLLYQCSASFSELSSLKNFGSLENWSVFINISLKCLNKPKIVCFLLVQYMEFIIWQFLVDNSQLLILSWNLLEETYSNMIHKDKTITSKSTWNFN